MGTRSLRKSQKMDTLIAKGVPEESGILFQPYDVMTAENKNTVHLQNNNLVPLIGTERELDKAYIRPSISFL